MKEIIKDRISRLDDINDNLLKTQCLDKDSLYYGSIIDFRTGYSEPARGVALAHQFLAAYCHKYSKSYKSILLLERSLLAIDYSLRRLHIDNTYDLTSTNPHDPTSLGFSVKRIAPSFRMLKSKIEKSKKPLQLEIDLYNKIIEFMTKASEGMVGNGFHTPNHRWVLGAGLALCMNILDMPELRDEIDKYLEEGIDCDEYGEYSERSVSIYNITINQCLIMMAKELKMPELLEHVRRNLYMTTKYIEPDGTLFTLNSTRQDMGARTYPFNLFSIYLTMAYVDKNPEFAYMAKYIHNMASKSKYDIGDQGYYKTAIQEYQYMDYNIDYFNEIAEKELNFKEHDSFFPNSSIARMRNFDTSMTLMANNQIGLKYQYKFLGIHLKVLGQNYIEFDQIEKTPSGYTVKGKDEFLDIKINATFLKDGAEIEIIGKSDFSYPCGFILGNYP